MKEGDLFLPLYFYYYIILLFYDRIKDVIDGYLSCWQVRGTGKYGIHISHILFFDDILVFNENSHDQMTYLSSFLLYFRKFYV